MGLDMVIDSHALWMKSLGWSEEEIAFARSPRPDWREIKPASLAEQRAFIDGMRGHPGLLDAQHIQAQGRYNLALDGSTRPADWPVRDALHPECHEEIKSTTVEEENRGNAPLTAQEK